MERKKNKDLEAMKQELQSFQVKMATKKQLLHSVYKANFFMAVILGLILALMFSQYMHVQPPHDDNRFVVRDA